VQGLKYVGPRVGIIDFTLRHGTLDVSVYAVLHVNSPFNLAE
jgi:hypothetical protein